MNHTKLGNSDLEVSRICMGCMGFGDAKNGQNTSARKSTFRSLRTRLHKPVPPDRTIDLCQTVLHG